jgi:hypothetical protein
MVLPRHQGAHCLDRHEHDALAERRANEGVPLVEVNGCFIDGVRNDATHTRDLRCGNASSQRIPQEGRAKTSASPLCVDGKATNQQEWHLLRHAAPQLCRRERSALLHCCGD